MKHLVPGVLHKIASQRKRNLQMRQGVGDEFVENDMLPKGPIQKKRSLRKFAAPATVIIDSPPALGTRAATRRMRSTEQSSEDEMVQVNTSLKPTTTKRSLTNVVEDLAAEISKNVPEIEEHDNEGGDDGQAENLEPISKQNLARKSSRLQGLLQTQPTETNDAEQEVIAGNQNTNANIESSKDKERKNRGQTKLSSLSKRTDGVIEVQWNSLGQPIGIQSTWLSSYIGALVREIVSYSLTNWRKLPQAQKDILWASIQVYHSFLH